MKACSKYTRYKICMIYYNYMMCSPNTSDFWFILQSTKLLQTSLIPSGGLTLVIFYDGTGCCAKYHSSSISKEYSINYYTRIISCICTIQHVPNYQLNNTNSILYDTLQLAIKYI